MAFRSLSIAFACAAFAGFGLTFASPAAADTKAGIAAWNAGDFERAVDEWRLPAAQGDADALFNLAQAYRLGRGVQFDLAKARDLYEAAAARGHVRAADNFGLLLYGQGDQERAMPMVRAAAERGDPRAQYVMGLAHFNGDYAERDWVRGYALVLLAQKAGLPQAGPALQQMDQFVAISQRQQAQSLARILEASAVQGSGDSTAPADSSQAPSSSAASTPEPKPVLVAGNPNEAAVIPASTSAKTPAVKAVSAPVSKPAAAPAPSPTLISKPITQPLTKPVAQPINTPITQPQASPSGKWALQLGAFGVSGNAERLWTKLSKNAALSGATRFLQQGRKLTVLYANGFASQSDAAKACTALKAQKQDCMVIRSPK